jgi:hypothetical protein
MTAFPTDEMPVRKGRHRLNSSPATQYGHRTTVAFIAIFTTWNCFVLEFRRRKLYASAITGM